jgi:PAS domain-containing protein
MIERVNPAFEELTGYASVEAVGQDLSWIAADGPKSEAIWEPW